MKKKMHPLQFAYAQAKAAFDVISEESTRRIALADDSNEDTYIAAIMTIERDLHYHELLDNLIAAQDAMVAWSFEMVKTDSRYAAHKAMLAPVLDNWKKYLKIKEQVIDLAFRLAV